MIQLKTANGKVDLQEDKNNITLTASVSKGAVNSVNGQQGDVVLDIPAKTSQLENDSDFQNEAEVKQLIASNALPSNGYVYDVLVCASMNRPEGTWVNIDAALSQSLTLKQWQYTESAGEGSLAQANEFYIAIDANGNERTFLYIKLPPNTALMYDEGKHYYFSWKVNSNDSYNSYENYLYWDGSFTFSPNTSDTFTIAYIYYR